MTRLLPAALLAAMLLASGCGGSSSKSSSAPAASTPPASSGSAAPPSTAPASAAGACKPTSTPSPKGTQNLHAPKAKLSPARTYTATLLTSCGTIKIALDVRHSPKTVSSFAYLAGRHFYDNLTFHRIVAGFVIQGGDPLGNGQGGPGYTVVERPPAGTHYTQGVVAMAKTAAEPAGASGSQFFIVVGPQGAQLPADYALLGRVTSGADTVARIAAVPADPSSGQPATPIVISKLSIAAH